MKTVTHTLLQELLEEQRQHVNHFFDEIDLGPVDKAVDFCLRCQGLIILTGVGKSGIIAEKIAMTLISTGTRAIYLPATNLLHGDIGAVGKDDLVFMISKSGQSQELIDLLPHLRRKGCLVAGVVSDPDSRLARGVDLVINLPVKKELCPFDLAPTTSTAVQLMFGDLLAVTLMKEKGFTLEDYAENHPSGSIGRKITLTVEDLMKKGGELPICKGEDRLLDKIVELSDKKCGCLLALNEENGLDGIFTDGDLRRALQTFGAHALEMEIQELMNRSPIMVEPTMLAQQALTKMQEKRYVTVSPVVENGRVVGLIRMHDIIHEGI